MTGFSSTDLQGIEEERQQAGARFKKAVADACAIGYLLNEIHGTNYSEKFWLYLVLPPVRKHQIRLYQQRLIEQQRTTAEIVGQRAKHSILIRLRGLKSLAYKTAKHTWNNFVSWIHYPKLKKKLATEKIFVYSFHELPELNVKYTMLPAAIPAIIMHKDRKKRDLANEQAKALLDQDQREVVLALPAYLVENFSALVKKVPLIDPEAKTFHVSIGHVDFMALVLALHFEHGARIIRYQHGSHYGEQAYFDSVERHNCSEFHTWGWKTLDQDVPDRAFRLEGFQRRYNSIGDRRRIDMLICFPAMYEGNIRRVERQSRYILRGIDRNLFPSVVARPRPMARYGSFRRSVSFLNDCDIVIDSGRAAIAELIATSRLVIHLEVPSTTFLECMHVNHPVMGIYFNLRPTEIVLPFYQFFFSVGVLHFSAESLVQHLESLSDVASWWRSVQEHAEYHDFKAMFCGQFSNADCVTD